MYDIFYKETKGECFLPPGETTVPEAKLISKKANTRPLTETEAIEIKLGLEDVGLTVTPFVNATVVHGICSVQMVPHDLP